MRSQVAPPNGARRGLVQCLGQPGPFGAGENAIFFFFCGGGGLRMVYVYLGEKKL